MKVEGVTVCQYEEYLRIQTGFDDLTSVRTVLNKRSRTYFLSTGTLGC